MSLKKFVKSRRKYKFFLLFMIIGLIVLTIIFLLFDDKNSTYKTIDILNDVSESKINLNQRKLIIPEKYNEHIVKSRLIENKIKYLTQNKDDGNDDSVIDIKAHKHKSEEKLQQSITRHVHVFYNIPVSWYKFKNSITSEKILDNNSTVTITNLSKSINVAFYPLHGLYNTTKEIIGKHFENIKKCGIGVVILSSSTSVIDADRKLTEKLFTTLINTAPLYNLTITIEITIHRNESIETDVMEQLDWLQKYYHHDGIYKVFSISKNEYVPLIYVKNAYKIVKNQKFLCPKYFDDDGDVDYGDEDGGKLRKHFMNAIFIGHIKSKQHVDLLRRLCFDGFYTRIPSNGATFASTWKNWSYLKTFAQTYKMLFIPTVGPGYAERNKPPRHGNIQRLRANGRYYGVAWRTAIANHIGFMSIASYNNWPEGTQIEEAITNDGFQDYAPGKPNKYLDLTAHWLNNFLKTRKPTNNCYEFFNNTIC